MNYPDKTFLPFYLEKLLEEQTDENRFITMPEIQTQLEHLGIRSDRRTVYKALSCLRDCGREIVYESRKGYRIVHRLSAAEAFFLTDAVRQSSFLSAAETEKLEQTILSFLSPAQRSGLQFNPMTPPKPDHSVLSIIEVLLAGIRTRRVTEFRYYDMTVSGKKQYRRQNRTYRMVPYAVVSNSGRYYCIFYSDSHKGFANYRLDKMDNVRLSEEIMDPVYFDLREHLRSSLQMYHGEAQTITADFDLSMASLVFDQFGSDIIISAVTSTTFRASIRTALTPTLISWLLQFEDRITVVRPQELIDSLLDLSARISSRYSTEKKGSL
ncbi:MAG: WYL domain-containing protein [Solobacterium sp.]|nr:WYL domain-containing protein [Solobacterium sp.]